MRALRRPPAPRAPLTLTLSPRRGRGNQIRLPLPEGEGGGEGLRTPGLTHDLFRLSLMGSGSSLRERGAGAAVDAQHRVLVEAPLVLRGDLVDEAQRLVARGGEDP